MSDGLETLPADVRAILRAERAQVTVPDDARTRLAERLGMGVPGFGPAHVPATTAPPPSGALEPAGAVVAKVLVVLALGGGAAATVRATLSPSPGDASHSPTQATAVIARELSPHAARVVVDEPDVTRTAPPMPAPVLTPAPGPAPSAVASLASLREERRLLDAARDAIVRGEPEAALAPTSSHAARFPHGVLAEERDALRIRALARLGRGDEARALLGRLRAEHPRSFLLEGAASDVEAIP